jgi:hypothetical protein
MNVRLFSIALVLSLSCGGAWSAAMPKPSAGSTVAEQYLFSAANVERMQRGLQPLRWDGALYQAASYHAQQMAERESISHQYQGEPELTARGEEAGVRFSVIAENVAEAPSALMIQQAWMNSPKHRANLLDPRVDSIAIRVVDRGGELYAVEDFDRSVMKLSLAQQESAVKQLLESTSAVAILPTTESARRTCSMETGYAGGRQPWFIMRYTAADLTRLPDMLMQKLSSGSYRKAEVGACTADDTHNFSAYSIAVMLYP